MTALWVMNYLTKPRIGTDFWNHKRIGNWIWQVKGIERGWIWVIDNIKMDLQEIEWRSLDFVYDRERCGVFKMFWWLVECYTVGESSWLAGKLLAFEDGLYSIECVNWFVSEKRFLKKQEKFTNTQTRCEMTFLMTVVKFILSFWINLEVMMVTGENTHTGWRKTYRRSPSVTPFRMTRRTVRQDMGPEGAGVG